MEIKKILKRKDMKEKIIELVNDCGPIKATELIVKLIEIHDISQNNLILDILNELVKNGDIIEVEYTLPQMNYRIKSLYFPKRTEIQIINNHETRKLF